jgi:hypothetical protein
MTVVVGIHNTRALYALLFCMVASVCLGADPVPSFFDGPIKTDRERLRQYPLPEQYKLFRYGNDVIHPPLIHLADPIAERGKEAVPFLLDRLAEDSSDLAIRDSIQIFKRMSLLRTYPVKEDKDLMDVLTQKVRGMKDDGWRTVCLRMLKVIADSGSD